MATRDPYERIFSIPPPAKADPLVLVEIRLEGGEWEVRTGRRSAQGWTWIDTKHWTSRRFAHLYDAAIYASTFADDPTLATDVTNPAVSG